MSIDVEEHFHAAALARGAPRAAWVTMPSRVVAATGTALDLFARAGVKATFFTLGSVAEAHPALIRRIVAEGHELASHGHAHWRIRDQTPAAFRADVARAKAALEDAGGVEVLGYRAPNFSIEPATWWAYDVLAETGHRYSSSVNPIRHDHYGLPDAPRDPFRPGVLGRADVGTGARIGAATVGGKPVAGGASGLAGVGTAPGGGTLVAGSAGAGALAGAGVGTAPGGGALVAGSAGAGALAGAGVGTAPGGGALVVGGAGAGALAGAGAGAGVGTAPGGGTLVAGGAGALGPAGGAALPGGLIELPMATVDFAARRWHVSGGGWFRLMPYPLFAAATRRVALRDGRHPVFYFHPWEVDPGQPRLDAPLQARFRHYVNLARMEPKLARLLRQFGWGRMDRVFADELQGRVDLPLWAPGPGGRDAG